MGGRTKVGQMCVAASKNQAARFRQCRVYKKYIIKIFEIRPVELLNMATIAALDSVVVHSMQISQYPEPAQHCDGAASQPSPEEPELENQLRYRSNQAFEASGEQRNREGTQSQGEVLVTSHQNYQRQNIGKEHREHSEFL